MARERGARDGADMTTLDTTITGFRGELLRPGDQGYDAARQVWNGAVDRRPAFIARCTSTADVTTAIRLAVTAGLPLAVRGGGHSIPGHSVCEGGLMLDLSRMRRITVDPERRQATAQPGVLLAELDAATQQHGLATPAGEISHTGIAGLTLGGGVGWLSRMFGSPATTCWRRRSSPRPVTSSSPGRSTTRSCCGGCAAVVATSASSRRSASGCTRWDRCSVGS